MQELTDLSGERLVRRTTVRRFERGGQEELRVTVRVDDGSRLGRLDPLAEDAVIATPDGQVVGDSTLASVGKRPPPLPAAPRRVLSRSQRGGRVEP